MYYLNGAVFVGQFSNGRANGPAHYVLPDGSYYSGMVKNNTAEDDNGYYESQSGEFVYRGGIKNNVFEGVGSEKGKNHEFKGTYKNGKKAEGILKWNESKMGETKG